MNVIFVPGTPVPQGSSRAFVRGGRAVITHANDKTMPWRADIAAHARAAVGEQIAIPRPHGVDLSLTFLMPRRAHEPKQLRPHTRKPDVDKLARAVCDALTGIVYEDDSQIVEVFARKDTAPYTSQPGVVITWTEVS